MRSRYTSQRRGRDASAGVHLSYFIVHRVHYLPGAVGSAALAGTAATSAGDSSSCGLGNSRPTSRLMTAIVNATYPAARAMCMGSTLVGSPASMGASILVVTRAMLVPIMRPPTLVAKLPPVP